MMMTTTCSNHLCQIFISGLPPQSLVVAIYFSHNRALTLLIGYLEALWLAMIPARSHNNLARGFGRAKTRVSASSSSERPLLAP